MRHGTFWPPFVLLVGGVVATMVGGAELVSRLQAAVRLCVAGLAPLFIGTSMVAVLACLIVAFSPLGSRRLGGPEAERVLPPPQYFMVALCTTVAVGILFWATAEPLYHLKAPPLGLQEHSPAAVRFAMATLLVHWTLIPYAIYAVPAVLFALVFYNRGLPFRLSSCLQPLFGWSSEGWLGDLVDSVCLFALVAGMAASLGAGILTLSGGVAHLTGLTSAWPMWVVIGLLVVATFVISAASGLERGIRILSQVNTVLFLAIIAFVFLAGPTAAEVRLTATAVWDFLSGFVRRGLLLDFKPGDAWPIDWTLFYWCNWLAWAPVTAVFLGRISRGYTVRQMLLFTWIFPSLFVTVWMGVLGGTSVAFDADGSLSKLLSEQGPEAVSYAIFAALPAAGLVIPLFLAGVFISYVTAADSNTLAMAGLCSTGISPDSPEPPLSLKLTWGAVVGAVSLVMICGAGIEGVKTLSNLGGVPALGFEMLCALALLKLVYEDR